MALTKISRGLLSTGISDSSDATAITIDSSENVKIEGLLGVNKAVNAAVALSVGADATSTTSYGLEVTNSTSNTRFLVNGEGSSFFYKTDNAVGMEFDATSGNLKFASGQGIDFSATGDGSGTMSNELLDDYEEGYWTPSLPEGGTISTYAATYTKIGRQVIAYFYIVVTPTNNTQQFKIGSLPYTCINQSGYYPSGSLGYSSNKDLSFLYPPLVMINDTYAYFHYNNGNANFVDNATMQRSGGLPLIGQVIYDAA